MLKHLEKGDIVDLIAPSGRFSEEILAKAIEYIESIGLVARVNENILSDDVPYNSNTDAERTKQLIEALNSDSKAVWAIRGGYGAMKLLDSLKELTPPTTEKIFIGFSDITVLHLFLNQEWGWSTIHGPVLSQSGNEKYKQNFDKIEKILFGKETKTTFELTPLNDAANENSSISAAATGGNLCLVENSIGTFWEIDFEGKILILEDVNEAGYAIDRTLEHLRQAGLFENKPAAIVFGDFTGDDPNISYALKAFAESYDVPIFKTTGIGHDYVNYPFIYGEEVVIENDQMTFDYYLS